MPKSKSKTTGGSRGIELPNRYAVLMEKIFFDHWHEGATEFEFERSEIADAAARLNIEAPKNLGDLIYTFRYRSALPKSILATQPEGLTWLILGAGEARYRYRLSRMSHVQPSNGLLVRKIPNATPEIISQYAFSDEQALLAKIRYNRLIDVFLGITAYSLQNHLRTKIDNYGQIEIDELYIGVDSKGAHYVVPVQAKGGKDKLGVIQTIQDTVFCQAQERYRDCIPRPVSAQFMSDSVIALFELVFDGDEVSIVRERHYRLVEAKDIRSGDLQRYKLAEPD